MKDQFPDLFEDIVGSLNTCFRVSLLNEELQYVDGHHDISNIKDISDIIVSKMLEHPRALDLIARGLEQSTYEEVEVAIGDETRKILEGGESWETLMIMKRV